MLSFERWRLIKRPLLVGRRITARHNVGRSGRILVGEVVGENGHQDGHCLPRKFDLALRYKLLLGRTTPSLIRRGLQFAFTEFVMISVLNCLVFQRFQIKPVCSFENGQLQIIFLS